MGQRHDDTELAELRSSRAWTEDEGRRVLAALASSGKSVAAFARQHGFVAQRLSWWRKRLGVAGVTLHAPPSTTSFLPVVVCPEQSVSQDSHAAVVLPDGVRLEVSLDDASAAWVVAVLSGLRRSAS